MNVLTNNIKGVVNLSFRKSSYMYPYHGASSVAAMRSFITGKSEINTSRKDMAVNFDTIAGFGNQPYPLSKEEAFLYVEKVLGLEHPEKLFKTDPLGNLTKMAERIKKKSPFTTMSCWDGSLFRLNDEYGKRHMLHGHCGGCVFINPFTKAILDHLGYKTSDVYARVGASTDLFHISTIVFDISHPGSLHLVEPGTVRPIFHPISLNFEQESPVYEVFGLRNKFFKSNNGNLVWCMEPLQKMLSRLGDNEIMRDSTGKEWQIFLIYMLKDNMGRYHFNQYLQKALRSQGYIPPRTRGFVYNVYKNGDLINVFASSEKVFVQTIQKDGTEETQKLTKKQLLRFFEENFPGFPTRMVERAIRVNFDMTYQLLRGYSS